MERRDRAPALSTATRYLGVVASFDDATGLGAIAFDGDGAGQEPLTLDFHCTQIADGSRSIAEGTRVRFQIMPVNLGHFEAGAIERGLEPL